MEVTGALNKGTQKEGLACLFVPSNSSTVPPLPPLQVKAMEKGTQLLQPVTSHA